MAQNQFQGRNLNRKQVEGTEPARWWQEAPEEIPASNFKNDLAADSMSIAADGPREW